MSAKFIVDTFEEYINIIKIGTLPEILTQQKSQSMFCCDYEIL